MNHSEIYQMEVYVSKRESDWLNWCANCKKMLGHDLDGDQNIDGYSIDYAYDVFLNGIPAEYGTVKNQPSTGNTIFAFGERALEAVRKAEGNNFGMTHRGIPSIVLVGISPSWVGVIEIAITRLNGKGSVQEVYEAVERLAPDKIQGNVHWKEKIRQKLQEHFTKVGKGIYSLGSKN